MTPEEYEAAIKEYLDILYSLGRISVDDYNTAAVETVRLLDEKGVQPDLPYYSTVTREGWQNEMIGAITKYAPTKTAAEAKTLGKHFGAQTPVTHAQMMQQVDRQKWEKEQERLRPEPLPEMPSLSPWIEQLISVMPYNQGQWAIGQIAKMAPGFDKKRMAWWESLHTPETFEGIEGDIGRRQGALRESLATSREGIEEDQGIGLEEDRLRGEIGELQQELQAGEAGEERRVAGLKRIDPLQSYLAQYPFQREFIKLPPRARGVRTSRFSPFTQWR